MPQGFDVSAARQAGYGDDEILQHLTQTRSFDVNGALSSGYSKADVINYLSSTPASSQAPQATIGPRRSGVLPWLRNIESDIRTGGGMTAPGRFLRMLGAPGIESGTTPETANQIAGPLVGTWEDCVQTEPICTEGYLALLVPHLRRPQAQHQQQPLLC